MNLFEYERESFHKLVLVVARYMCGVLIVELSRVVVLASRPVEGDTVS
jgi:hypothetical protein